MTKPEEEKLYEKLQYLYESGKFGEIISEYDLLSPETRFPGIKKLVGFSFYNQRNYDECRKIISELSEEDNVELRAYMAAYVDKDERKLLAIYRKFPHNPSVCNALVICARNKGSSISLGTVRETLEITKDNSRISAHLFHNGGRYCLDQGRYAEALSYFLMADSKYDKKSYPDKGALFHWMSVAFERRGFIPSAWDASKASEGYWKEACRADPTNVKFRENYENEKKRSSELFFKKA